MTASSRLDGTKERAIHRTRRPQPIGSAGCIATVAGASSTVRPRAPDDSAHAAMRTTSERPYPSPQRVCCCSRRRFDHQRIREQRDEAAQIARRVRNTDRSLPSASVAEYHFCSTAALVDRRRTASRSSQQRQQQPRYRMAGGRLEARASRLAAPQAAAGSPAVHAACAAGCPAGSRRARRRSPLTAPPGRTPDTCSTRPARHRAAAAPSARSSAPRGTSETRSRRSSPPKSTASCRDRSRTPSSASWAPIRPTGEPTSDVLVGWSMKQHEQTKNQATAQGQGGRQRCWRDTTSRRSQNWYLTTKVFRPPASRGSLGNTSSRHGREAGRPDLGPVPLESSPYAEHMQARQSVDRAPVSLADIHAAAELIWARSPITAAEASAPREGPRTLNVHVKHENHNPTGAFKVRGGFRTSSER